MRKAKAPAPAAQPGLPAPDAGPLDLVRNTRRPLAFWDRAKFLILIALIWPLLVWSMMANNPLVGFDDAVKTQLQQGWWAFVLFGAEALRQVHYFICERSARYYQ